MAQQLKTKNINFIPGQLFCRQCKAKFSLETGIDSIDDEDKIHQLQILMMNSLNVKHQGKNLTQVSSQLTFHQSV